ncbi:alpha-ketoglutarate dehydrogenase component 4 isoform X2 [Microcaecilia unicolor]|uniref:28S ribosomal protein S36, mitochondrial isoform X2 n=1 Tax=Microcaecilia unicolor TaxID=1415580 RepID=A0A6P7X710_9AMPH|nr:28S ribosomal protein S36, mitochondrial isoform X2 [Microcaecilia unicolor]
MGSKMAAASRVVQVVKPHSPLIKFPDRKTSPRPNEEALKSMVLAPTASQSLGAKGPGIHNMSFLSKTQETPDTLDLVRTLPQKYRRKAVSTEEMDYIQRGGPE